MPDTVAHLGDLLVQLFRVGQDEPGRGAFVDAQKARKSTGATDLVPWPVMRLPLGQMASQPLRLQLEWRGGQGGEPGGTKGRGTSNKARSCRTLALSWGRSQRGSERGRRTHRRHSAQERAPGGDVSGVAGEQDGQTSSALGLFFERLGLGRALLPRLGHGQSQVCVGTI